MNRISLLRFNALAGYTRLPEHVVFVEELAWYAHDEERMLGVVFRDTSDDDFGAITLVRDDLGRFRADDLAESLPSPLRAKDWLSKTLSATPSSPRSARRSARRDFFTRRKQARALSDSFRILDGDPRWSPARGLIDAMMHYYDDPDGNFIEQFQTTGFDARVWEMYLFAALVELGFTLDRTLAVPDFTCSRDGLQVLIEAVTVNPTRDGAMVVEPPEPDSPEEIATYLLGFAAIKFASALTSKLRKEYWKRPGLAGHPFVLAIQDFHRPRAMAQTGSALPQYLYGVRQVVKDTVGEGRATTRFEPIESHTYGGKVVPSNFFSLEGAENISAVVSSSCGTLPKFNRIGFLAGFGSRLVSMKRFGFRFDPEPLSIRPKAFSEKVELESYSERWAEGLTIYHNPRARHPLPPFMFGPGVADHRFRQGVIESYLPPDFIYGSVTDISLPFDAPLFSFT